MKTVQLVGLISVARRVTG